MIKVRNWLGLFVVLQTISNILPASADSVPIPSGKPVVERTSTYTSRAAGYSIDYPEGWSVATDPRNGQLNVIALDSARMSILPFFISGKSAPGSGSEKERIEIFKTLLRTNSPEVKWASPVVLNAGALKAEGDCPRWKIHAILLLKSTANGLAGQLCLTSRPPGMHSDTPQKFAQMLSTFHYMGRPSEGGNAHPQAANANAPHPVNYRTFIDPTEGAFSCEVPVGWNANGGIRRVNGLDTRPWAKITSPDNSVLIFIGDNEVPSFTIPTATMRSTGFFVGRQYGSSIVEPYYTARQFMQKYAQQRLSQTISNLQLVQTQDHPDIDRTVNGPSQMHSCSSAKFSGNFRGVRGVCYVLCATRANFVAGSGMWWVTSLSGVITTAEQDRQALEIYTHVYDTMQTNPRWAQQHNAMVGAITQANIVASQAKTQSIIDSYWSRQTTSAPANASSGVNGASGDDFDNYIRGTADMQDPTTGQTYNVTYGPETHWINNNTGTIFGADNTFQPGTDWHQLIDIQR